MGHQKKTTETHYLADTPTAEEAVEVLERTTRPNAVLQAVRTGEFRAPKAGEWFLSGAIPAAYRAANDLSGEYNILRLVAVYRVVSYEVEDSVIDAVLNPDLLKVSVGCPRDIPECEICSGKEKNPVVIRIPLRPPGEPNANGDIFPDGLQIPVGTKVRHEDKVIGEVSAVDSRKVIVRLERPTRRTLGDTPATEEFEVHISVLEVEPGSAPGVVGVRVDVTGIPVTFTKITDHGNHALVLRHAKYVLRSVKEKGGSQ
jgi:hypothetical protein